MPHLCYRRLALLLLLLTLVAPPARADGGDDDIDPIERAIHKGTAYLYKSQAAGHWEPAAPAAGAAPSPFAGPRRGELTAAAVTGLLAAGESPQNDKLSAALNFLATATPTTTTAAARKLRPLEFLWKTTPAQKQAIKTDAIALMASVHRDGAPDAGLHGPSLDAKGAAGNVMDTAEAVFAMRAVSRQNFEIPSEYWKLVDQGVRKAQLKSGAWESPGTTALTATTAAVATLLVAQEMLASTKPPPCDGNHEDTGIAAGLAWVDVHAAEVLKDPDPIAAFLNLQRIAHSNGQRYFGKLDWYYAGVAHLLKAQEADGSWTGGGHPAIATAAALQLLNGKKFPLLMSKLEYQVDVDGRRVPANWNQRPHDLFRLAKYIGAALPCWDDSWQTVNLNVPLGDLYDGRLLYIAGNQPLSFTKAEEEKLRQYVRQGGMILGNADCDNAEFAASFEKLGERLFPYQFRTLPNDHPIYGGYFRPRNQDRDTPPLVPLRGLSNGARELMLLIPKGDLSKHWQSGNLKPNERPFHDLTANIAIYAGGLLAIRTTHHGRPHLIARDPAITAARTINLARIRYDGNWDPEPAGWERLANQVHNARAVDLTVTPVQLGGGKLSAKDYPVAHLTGTAAFHLTDAQRAELKAFVDAGGTLIIDSAGGGAAFTAAAQAELAAAFPAAAKELAEPLPVTHPLYDKLERWRFRYRAFTQQTQDWEIRTPRIRGVTIDQRTAIYFSPEDLSVGLVGQDVDRINGYAPATATELMTRMTAGAAK